ncbi:hypothetical protein [Actinomadura nitritigenes]|uniref:Uncharacterized protein n=1 Tax=Actinomadura nitritigenes TaxID=134602 RepID=A0ABS3RG84_9ACTN|nr:hypothetical protein [Actinomadura nitritigenes]MBO2445242.1 hypothetical protein [Actinomadura nitritigenes]
MAKKRTKAWTLAGAARAVRDARIATMQHMQSAPIARHMQEQQLRNAFALKVAHLRGDKPTANALLFGGMGYRDPFPPFTDWAAAADTVVTDEARYLAEAELYVLSPHMCDVVIAAAQSLTLEDLELLGEEDLPGPTGLVMLPRPVLVRTAGGNIADLRAFTWRVPSSILNPSLEDGSLGYLPAVRVSSYNDTHGPVRPDTFLQLAAAAREHGTPLPPLLLDAIKCAGFRYTAAPEQLQVLRDYLKVVKKSGAATRAWHAAHGQDENRVIGEYTPDSQLDDPEDTFQIRFLYAFWRLSEQRITTLQPAPLNHSAQLQADRAGVPADVRVVQLRRTQQAGENTLGGRDWQHRWVVRMHKVRQWYPSLQQHKVIYRGPYIKGPADKPLLGGETVRGLTR